MVIASVDNFYGGYMINKLFTFSNLEPFNEHFEENEIDDMNFLNNSASLILPIFVVMILI